MKYYNYIINGEGKGMILKIKNFIRNGLGFVVFMMKLIYHGHFRNSIKRESLGTIVVLANGPSLKEVIPKLTSDKFKDVDFIVLNFFAFSEAFFQMKPKYYCLADPMFYQDSLKVEDVKKLYEILDHKVNWKMYIYVPSTVCEKIKTYSKFKNRNLIIIPINNTEYSGWECFRNFFYKKGLAIPRIQTVANLAVYASLNNGYKMLQLYGFDHTFLSALYVDENNQLYNKNIHFYEKREEIVLTPIIFEHDKKVRISDYVDAISNMFKSHDLLAAYGRYLNVKIINKTNESMIDSYDRK